MPETLVADTAPARRPSVLLQRLLVLAAVAASAASWLALAPAPDLLLLLGVLAWFGVPGVVLARRLYGPREGGWAAALLAGPPWGYVLSAVVMLGLWAAGIRQFGLLMLAPIPATALVWPARRLASNLSAPPITKRELAAVLFVLLSVPAIVGLPYAHVGKSLPEGRAYRAYFTADMVWAVAVVSEVSKGDMPPKNPFYLNDSLHYYWLAHLLPAAEHRSFPRQFSIDQILLVNAVAAGLAFVAFFYFFVRHFVDRAWSAALACVGVIFCSSFEGAERLLTFWRAGVPLNLVRNLNIDAVTRAFYNGMPIDGLQRLVLYQPQHQLTYLCGFSAVLLLYQARDAGRAGLLFLVGVFLALALMLSPLDAGMLTAMAAAYETWRLVKAGRWRAFVPCAVAAAVPMAASLALAFGLHYVDSGTGLVTFGVNPVATSRVWTNLFLSMGPVLIAAVIGTVAAAGTGALGRLSVIWVALATCTFFYFLVDVPDHQSVYFGWHAAHLAFIASAALIGVGLQAAWDRGGAMRVLVPAVTGAVALAGLPTSAIDIYNTQDVWNRASGPGFRWTVLISPGEQAALDWIKRSTNPDARVQVEPDIRGRDTWSYIPTFAERRMSYGWPISMIPLAKYERAKDRVRALYRSPSVDGAYAAATAMCIDYLVVGPPERAAYRPFQEMLDANPYLFPPMFRNDDVAVYGVANRDQRSSCPR